MSIKEQAPKNRKQATAVLLVAAVVLIASLFFLSTPEEKIVEKPIVSATKASAKVQLKTKQIAPTTFAQTAKLSTPPKTKTSRKTTSVPKKMVRKKLPVQRTAPAKKHEKNVLVRAPLKKKKTTPVPKKKAVLKKQQAIPESVYDDLEKGSHQAIDQTSPLDELVAVSFEEAPLLQNYDANTNTSQLALDAEFRPNNEIAAEKPLPFVVSRLQKNENRDLKKSLKKLKAEVAEITETKNAPPKPKPEVLSSKSTESNVLVNPETSMLASASGGKRETKADTNEDWQESIVVHPSEAKLPASAAKPAPKPSLTKLVANTKALEEVEPPPTTQQRFARNTYDEDRVFEDEELEQILHDDVEEESTHLNASAHFDRDPENEKKLQYFVATYKKNSLIRDSDTHHPGARNVVIQEEATQNKTRDEVPLPKRPRVAMNFHEDKPSVIQKRSQDVRTLGKVYGLLLLDSDVQKELEDSDGHVQVYATPVGVRDTHRVEYAKLEGVDFEFEKGRLDGPHYLWARLFEKGKARAVARVRHPEIISPDNYKKRIRFSISRRDVNNAIREPKGIRKRQSLALTIFEAGVGHYRKPKEVSGAVVTLIGVPEKKPEISDENGDVVFKDLPVRSDFLIKVEKDAVYDIEGKEVEAGFYPTYRTVHLHVVPEYEPIYLLSRTTVESITSITGRPQVNRACPQGDAVCQTRYQKAVLMGREFGTNKRPAPDKQVGLSFRRGSALYFDYWLQIPKTNLRETSRSGLFSFMNVTPAFRWYLRKSYNYLVNALPGAAYHFDFGRNRQAIKGKILNQAEEVVDGVVSIYGDSDTKRSLDEGEFRFPKVDFPNGPVTLETVYPKTRTKVWHTVAHTNRVHKDHQLYTVSEDLIEQLTKVSHVSLENKKGHLLGGVGAPMFEGIKGCLRVKLLDQHGKALAPKFQPKPLAYRLPEGKRLCLTQEYSGFVSFNNKPGDILVRLEDSKGRLQRMQFHRLGSDRWSMAID